MGDAAAQNYFYAVDDDEGGRSMAVEQALSELEGAAAAAIDRLLTGDFPPTADTREAVAAFLWSAVDQDATSPGPNQPAH